MTTDSYDISLIAFDVRRMKRIILGRPLREILQNKRKHEGRHNDGNTITLSEDSDIDVGI